MIRTGPAPLHICHHQPRRGYAHTFSPMGNAWPIYRSGPNAGDPIPGWVSFHNTNASYPAQYYRANNEDVGLDLPNQYLGFYITKSDGVKFYSGPVNAQPNGTIRVCDNSPLYGGGYFRVGVITSLEDEVDQIRIYPNPSSGEVRISGGEVENVSVTSPDGRVMSSSGYQDGLNYRLDLSGLSPGLYIIKATVAGRKIYEKVVKL